MAKDPKDEARQDRIQVAKGAKAQQAHCPTPPMPQPHQRSGRTPRVGSPARASATTPEACPANMNGSLPYAARRP